MVQITIMLLGAAMIGFLLGWILQKLQRDRIQAELRFIREKHEALQLRSEGRAQDYSEMQRQVEDLRQRKDALLNELEAQKKENGLMSEQLEKAGDTPGAGRLQELEAERNALADRVEELTKANSPNNEGDKALREALDRALEEQKALQLKLQQADVSVNHEVSDRMKELQIENARLNEQLHKAYAAGGGAEDIASVKLELEKMQRQNRELKSDIEELEDRLEERPIQVGDPKEVAALRLELAALKQEKEELMAKVAAPPSAAFKESAVEERPSALSKEDIAARKSALLENIGQATEISKDSLTKIVGIGPFIEAKLNSIGVFTYDQIARMEPGDIDHVTHLIEFFPGRIERDGWVRQAKKLIDKRNE